MPILAHMPWDLVTMGNHDLELKDTIASFNAILKGEVDDLPEQAFYMVGTIDEARQKAETLKA